MTKNTASGHKGSPRPNIEGRIIGDDWKKCLKRFDTWLKNFSMKSKSEPEKEEKLPLNEVPVVLENQGTLTQEEGSVQLTLFYLV